MFGSVGIQERQRDFDVFLDLFSRATANIEGHYFQLPVAQIEKPVYRERVYCYELYHRVREQMPPDFRYNLDGELDKTGHPLIQNVCGKVKPDFLIHERGVMNQNLVVLEVKPITASRYGIRKDVKTLCCFLERASYFRAIYLIYGDNETLIARILRMVQNHIEKIPDECIFFVMHHRKNGIPAEIIWANR